MNATRRKPDLPDTAADRIIAVLNRLVRWCQTSRFRCLAIYVIGGCTVAGLVAGMKFGSDILTLPEKLVAFFESQVSQEAEASKEAAPTPAPLSAPAVDLPQSMIAELIRPTVEAKANFGRHRPIDPGKLCSALSDLGMTGARIQTNPISGDKWSCDSDVVSFGPAPADGSSVRSSIFASLRGGDSRRVDLIRLKLNLTDPETADVTREKLVSIIGELHERLGWRLPQEVAIAVNTMTNKRIERFGVDYNVFRDETDPPRLNIVIKFDDGVGIVPTTAFSAFPGFISPPRQISVIINGAAR